jgi:hypothetical protein
LWWIPGLIVPAAVVLGLRLALFPSTAVMIVITAGLVLFGGLIGTIFTVACGIRREERRYFLTSVAPGVAARGVRQLNGVGDRQGSRDEPPF